MKRKSQLVTSLFLVLLSTTNALADKKVFGWNQTAGVDTQWLDDCYWLSIEYYSPVWFDIVDQGDTLFDLHSPYTVSAMEAFVDAAHNAHPGTKVVPMVQYLTDPADTTQLNSLLKSSEQRTRIVGQIACSPCSWQSSRVQ